jgi:nucleoside 2-deoxyribosyltransferase
MTTLKIAGGIYREICQFPERREILGSGGRGAAALSSLNADIELHSFVSATAERDVLESLLVYGFSIITHRSASLISFRWLHGLASPQQEPLPAVGDTPAKMEVRGDVVLRYGMVEGHAIVHGETVVYDPQAPLRAVSFRENGSSAKCLAYVINSAEAVLLTKETEPFDQLRYLHDVEGAAVVVLKQGPHGALVSDGARTTRVPCYKTDNVWSIGSGDVFSAVFCHFWAIEKRPAADAAFRASLATAFYCNGSYLPLPRNFQEQATPVECVPTTRIGERRQVYLAGPFFTVAQRWLIDSLRETFRKLDVEVFSPIHDVGEGKSEIVAPEDLIGIHKSNVVFAVCDGLDAGTLFEIGYAFAHRIPVIAFTQVENESDLTMLRGTGCAIEKDLDTAIYKAIWTALES